MGLDLTLCPNPFSNLGIEWDGRFLAYDRISLKRNYTIFAQICPEINRDWNMREKQRCNPKPMPVPVAWYNDEGIETITEDAYGKPLTYVTAGELSKIKVPKDTSDWNKAVFALIRSLDPETQILLYWH
jgi:hypothetical protein